MYKTLVKRSLLRLGAMMCHDSSPKVVYYHDVGQKYTFMGTPEDIFWSHMALLRNGDVVCFDDGFRGIWDVGEKVGVLSCEMKVKIIVFLAVGLVGKPGYLTWDEIRELQDKYGIEFQCHTWSHQTLVGPYNDEVPEPVNGRTEEWYRHELVDSKAELEGKLGKKVAALCFPVGNFSADVIRRCKEAGYVKVYASYPGDVTDEYVQPRCLVQSLSASEFMSVLNGGMCMFRARYLNMHCQDQ